MDGSWTIKRLLDEMYGRGDVPALIAVSEAEVRSWSNGALALEAQRLAAGLLDDGLQPGEPVALWGANSAAWIVAAFAVTAAGGVMVAVDDLATDEAGTRAIVDSGSRRAFVSGHHVAALRSLPDAGQRRLVRLDEADPDDDEAGAHAAVPHWRTLLATAARPLPDLAADAPASLAFTSGTTGRPKAFHLTHGNIAANVEAVVAARIVEAGDRVLLPLPFHHAYPWVIGILTALTAGVTIVLPEAVSGPHLVRALKAGDVTVMVGVPRLYEALMTGLEAKLAGRSALVGRMFAGVRDACFWCRDRLAINPGRVLFAPVRRQVGPKVRLMVSGGARLEAAVIRKIKGLGWEILTGYGLAETASIFTFNTPQAQRVGSEGRPAVKGSEVRIGDADATGLGEIQMRGSSVFSGYLDNPEANAAAFTDDGWFRTGDRGRVDEDGYVYVLGRLTEMIVLSGGKNVDPESLEKAYGGHPHIAEIGIFAPAGALAALVRPDLAAIRADGLTRVDDAIRVALAGIGRHLPPYQRLAGFAVTRDPLPRTRLMKLRRFMLPDLYARALSGADRAPAAAMSDADRALVAISPARDVWALLQEKHPQQQLTMDVSPQLDLGMDSFAWMSFVVELESRAGVQLSEDAIGRIETLRDLIHEVNAAGSAPARVPAEQVEALLRPPGAAMRLLGVIVFVLTKAIMRTVFRLRVEGLDRLPQRGPFVLTPNHVSDLDPVALAASLPLARLRQTWWAADVVRLHATVLGRRLCRATRVYPVSERAPAIALSAAERVLAGGEVQVWFPESWRSPDGRLQRFLPGIGKLLSESRAAAVPVLIEGTFEALPRGRRWPKPHAVRVVFGAAVAYDELRADAAGDDDYDGIAAALRERLAALASPPPAITADPAEDEPLHA